MTDQPTGARRAFTWLFDPFYFWAGGKALAAGLVAMGLTGALGAMAGVRFDGVLDLHYGLAMAPAWRPFVDLSINWGCQVIVFGPAALALSGGRARMIDVAGTQALARWPQVWMAAMFCASPVSSYMRFISEATVRMVETLRTDPAAAYSLSTWVQPGNTLGMVLFIVASLLTLPLMVWMVALMYRGFATSAGVRGWKAGLTFTGGLVVAEILSKIVIWLF